MPSGIVYLDIDDEITSAAARIRDRPERRVAVVLPYGSRVATSRINFRLLSRDAMINEKQLAVVAGDSATRALAASAGLPVFASVGEYESSQAGPPEGPDGAAPGGTTGETAPPTQPDPTPKAPTSGKRSRRGSAASAGDAAETGPPAERPSSSAPAPPSTPTGRLGASPGGPPPASAAAVSGAAATAALPSAPRRPASGAVTDETVQVEIPWTPTPPDDRPWRSSRPASGAQADQRAHRRPTAGRSSRLPIVIVLAALALVLLVGGVGAYVVLPSVSIVVTPRPETITLPAVTVTADPNATDPDAAARVVPAQRVPVEVTVSETFPATGKRVEEERARGTVRFSNLDFLRSNTIPAGSIVSTNAGVRFQTVAEVTVPRADLVGLTVFPGRIAVNVTAVEPGTAGNVEPNTIVVVPRGKDPQALKVVNPEATTGGTREEFAQVAQEDVDGAVEQLTEALGAAFDTKLADPAIAPPGATVFAETAVLGEPTPSVDPDTLVGQEIETFELGLSAAGTVLTVDPAPVTAIAEALLRGRVDRDHRLVAGSIEPTVGAPVVSEGTVTFSASATGQQVRVLDADELTRLVIGKPLEEARAALEPFGDVELTAWPDWVGSVPTIEDRVDLRIGEGAPVEDPTESGASS